MLDALTISDGIGEACERRMTLVEILPEERLFCYDSSGWGGTDFWVFKGERSLVVAGLLRKDHVTIVATAKVWREYLFTGETPEGHQTAVVQIAALHGERTGALRVHSVTAGDWCPSTSDLWPYRTTRCPWAARNRVRSILKSSWSTESTSHPVNT